MGLFNHKEKKINEKPVTDIIGLSLNKSTYQKLKNRIKEGQNIDELTPIASSPLAKHHREKILREETTKQFSHPYRPVIELILNGVDAKPKNQNGDYSVEVNVNGKEVVVKDRGKGMSLENILTTLLIPFSSDKEEEVDIGRFGVGFFSSLGYCLSNPGNSSLEISTTEDRKNYKLRFEAKSENVEDLLCQISKGFSLKSGTNVQVDFKHKKRDLARYIEHYLDFFDPQRAQIKVNGKVVNNNGSDSKEVVYPIPTTFNDGQFAYSRIGFKKTRRKGRNSLHSQGVFVTSRDFPHYNIKIDLPSKLLLVEGRDEFKQDENYITAFRDVVEYVCRNNKQIARDVDPNLDIKEFLINLIEATDLPLQGFFDEIIKRNMDNLFEKGTYIIEDYDKMERCVDVTDFFGSGINSRLYLPQTEKAFRFWSKVLPGFYDLLKNSTEPANVKVNEFLKESPSLVPMSEKLSRMDKNGGLYLVNLKEPRETSSPFIGNRDFLHINVQHPMLKEDSFLSRYMSTAYIERLIHGERRAEGNIIY